MIENEQDDNGPIGPGMKAQVEPTAHFKPEQRGYEGGKTAGVRKRQLINFDGLVKSRHTRESGYPVVK